MNPLRARGRGYPRHGRARPGLLRASKARPAGVVGGLPLTAGPSRGRAAELHHPLGESGASMPGRQAVPGRSECSSPSPIPTPPHPKARRDRLDRLRLLRSRRVGPATYHRLLKVHGSAAAALEALPCIARESGLDAYAPCPAPVALAEIRAARAAGARAVFLEEPDYPRRAARRGRRPTDALDPRDAGPRAAPRRGDRGSARRVFAGRADGARAGPGVVGGGLRRRVGAGPAGSTRWRTRRR